MTVRRIIFVVATLAAVVLAFVPLIASERNPGVRDHHLDHALLMLLGAIAGFAAYRNDSGDESPAWVWAAVAPPIVAMLLMAPSLYAVVDTVPWLHVLDHLVFLALSMLTVYGGQRYVRGVGWASGLMLETMAVVAAFGYGVAPASVAAAAPLSVVASTHMVNGNSERGKQLFAQNCAVCHAAKGQGGVGPPLKGEASRKSVAQLEAWIKKPLPPMPTLYPKPLNDDDVTDIAAFVESMK